MKTRKDTKLISALLVMLITLSSTSCASKKRTYEVIKETDPWYEVTSFEASSVYSSEEYEYSYFEKIGASEDSVYIMAQAQKNYSGDLKNLTDEQLAELYEQSILRFSYDGELLEKTDAFRYENGKFRSVQKAWISDGQLNILEQTMERNGKSKSYLLNGKEISIPETGWHESEDTYIRDLYTTNGYTVFHTYDPEWEQDSIVVARPDGSEYQVYLSDVFQYAVNDYWDMIPAESGKVIFPVIVVNDLLYVQLDLATGKASELKGLYGSEDTYMLEYCNDKTVVRDFYGLSFLDPESGNISKILDYGSVDESFYDIIDTETLYVSDDGSEVILGGYTYDNTSMYSSLDGYKIMHLKRADKNPNAGKTIITLSLGKDSYPEYSDLYAAKIYNRQDNPCFVKFVMPYDDSGEYQDVNPDILLICNPVIDPADSTRYLDLAPYLNLNDPSYKSDYFWNAIEASKSGDSLYLMPLDISASGVITSSSNVPDGKKGFTFEEYKKFLNDVCNGNDPISKTPGYLMSKPEYFTTLFMNMSDVYIKDGKVDLKGEDFRSLMLFVDEYGSDVGSNNDGLGFGYVTEHNRAITEIEAEIDGLVGETAEIDGKLGAVYGNFYSFENYIDRYRLFGSTLSVYGLPSYDGRGPQTVSSEFVCIADDTKFPEACAEFVKVLLSYDVQCHKESNPINRKATRYVAEQKLKAYNESIEIESQYDKSVKKAELSPDIIDKYEEILSSSYGGMSEGSAIEQILMEESSAYFNGQKSMDDVITVMQKRLQTVIDESK
ncbi:MAG: hypothetical protein IKZ42_01135 [Clostridiales bacterium]|nr:hypothetical protein [Clostridiales bacterium]